MTPPRTRRRRIGPLIGITTAGSWLGGLLVEALMWAMVVEVRGVGLKHRPRVALTVEQQPVGALLPDAADDLSA